jgi:alginate O-acetyltransferase complex protein AlgI
MLFNSFQYLVFFPLVTIVYFLIPHNYRWFHLLLSSCIFYMFFIPVYILILFVTILVDYYAAIYIEKSEGKMRKRWLIFSICSTCLVLFIFKYFNFFNLNFKAIASIFNLNYSARMINIILPIGLSFHTFQSLSYVIEVYRKNQKTERHLGIYALYVMFYPQLVAGPIERPQNLLHQFREQHHFEIDRFYSGLQLMIWGYFKKIVIADRLSHFVKIIFDNPGQFYGYHILLGVFFFAVQIYCDFSGYSDIARASARIIGFDLMVNFRRPYFSKSISVFWKRWHISLSSWFRDYLYIPLGGNRVPKLRWYSNLFITFSVSGLWHGANWTYVLWGMLNGLYLILSTVFSSFFYWISNIVRLNYLKSIQNVFKVLIVFLLVNIGWIFFRANKISDVWTILSNMTVLNLSNLGIGMFGKSEIPELVLSVIFILFLLTIELMLEKNIVQKINHEKIKIMKFLFFIVLFNLILYFGIFNNEAFIYFQF